MSIPDDHHPLNPTGFDYSFAIPADWAAMYRALRLQVIPSYLPGEIKGSWKRPLASWADLQDALAPALTFERWYGTKGDHRTRSNMGVLTGRCSDNVYVIDLDIHKHPEAAAWWDGLLAVHNNTLPLETPTQQTGGGGLQMLFKAPVGWSVPTNRTAIGVDIRGQGGFAVLPPSRHESGREYAWLDGLAPWEIPIADSPPWLVEAIMVLVATHGGTTQQKTTSAPPGTDYDAFGHRQDGREDYMTRVVWGAVVDRYRESPIRPPEAASMIMAKEAYEAYERGVVSRLSGAEKRAGLEAEGRGQSAFWAKWQSAMKHWDGKVAEEAGKPNPKAGTNYSDEKPKIDPQTGEALPLILTAEQFLRGFVPPDYLIDGLVQKSYLYSLTARTGHGKTAVAMLMASCVARGVPFHGHPTSAGRVLFLAGENPQDVRARYKVLADHEQFAPESTPFYFVDGVVDIAASMARIREEAAKIGDLLLVVVDTATAYFRGDDSNSNAQQGLFAQLLRQLIKLPGSPAVVVNCHPVKNAAQDNLIPLGGSNFINEVDGNLTLWADDKTCTLSPHQAKWRGAPFEQVEFELRTVLSDAVKDSKGRHLPSVVAVPITEAGAERNEATAEADDKALLKLMHGYKNASMSELARLSGFVLPNGTPYKSKVQRIMGRLKASKLIYNYHGSKYRLTKKGCKIIGVKWEKEGDEE